MKKSEGDKKEQGSFFHRMYIFEETHAYTLVDYRGQFNYSGADMKLTRDQVHHVAHLARLGLSPKEVEKFQKELSTILDYVDRLSELDEEIEQKKVKPTAQVTGAVNIMEADEPIIFENPAELLSCSPLPQEDNQIKVKPVF